MTTRLPSRILLGIFIFLAVLSLLAFMLRSFLSTAVLSYLFVARPFQVNGQSMSPALKDSQFIVTRISNASTKYERGNVIVYRSARKPDIEYLKRIIALPGETVSIGNGSVYVNGGILDETSYTTGSDTFGGTFLAEGQTLTVPADSYFVLGDNRRHSTDSRSEGFVHSDNIVGTYWFCYWNCK